MTAAIYYLPEAYTTSGPKLMGRNAAGESFLRGWLAHASGTEFWLQVEHQDHARSFADKAREAGRQEPIKLVGRRNLAALSQPGALYFPSPGIGKQAWYRAPSGHEAWSLIGITHTTSSAAVGDDLTDLLTAPVQPWDALICTSTAVKNNVSRLLQSQAGYLAERLGAQRMVLPQLPVIPLGIQTADFTCTPEQRASARATLEADAGTLVVLFVGRLSFHAKAHPLAMYQALERAASSLPGGQNLMLVECGWHANDTTAKAYAAAAAHACPSVKVVTLDGRDAQARRTAWASGDVFCSLSDNIQETFGITPIEAMAAGMPVVVSDWDGYKDTVRDGVDGFRIPTLMPQGGMGTDLAARHALGIDSYDRYCGYTCSLIAVDVEAASQAFSRLFSSPSLRHQMGAAGRQRAREVFDWSAIIPRYETLFGELAKLRQAQTPGPKTRQPPWPARMDPFEAYASYPTRTLTPQTVLERVDDNIDTAIGRVTGYSALDMVNFAAQVLPTPSEIRTVLEATASGPQPAASLVAGIPAPRRAYVLRALVWLVKMGVLRVSA